MAEDINKKITIDVEVNTDGQQQINQYKAAFSSLRSAINNLGKPMSDFSKNVAVLDKDITQIIALTEKWATRASAIAKQVSVNQGKANKKSNEALKTSLTEADKIREQAFIKAMASNEGNYGKLAATESVEYEKQKKRLDDFFSQKGMDQQLYQKSAQQLLQQHLDKLLQITKDYAKDAAEITGKLHDEININTKLSQPDIKNVTLSTADLKPKEEPLKALKPPKSFFSSIGDNFKKLFGNVISYYKDGTKNVEKVATDSAKTTNDKVAAINKAGLDQKLSSSIDNAKKISDSVFSIMAAGANSERDYKILVLEKQKADETNNAADTAAQKASKIATITAAETNAKKKAFKANQKAGIAQAIINGAIAITKSEADLGPIAGTIAIAAIVAQTAAQVTTIAKQQPPALAKGGYFKSDGKGTVLPGYSRTDNTNAYLRSGEAVVVSEAMQVPWARNLVSAINVGFGGRDFSVSNPSKGYAIGGIFTDGGNANRYYNQPVTDQKNLANTIAYQMINNFPPVYVDVKDINNQQNILAQTINRVNL